MTLALPHEDVLRHIVDVHCHPTDAAISSDSMDRLKITVCAMSTMISDQQRVRDLATLYPQKVVPCFGYHPWFTHLIAVDENLPKEAHYRSLFNSLVKVHDADILAKFCHSLPDPTPLSFVLAELRHNLSSFPSAMLGEVGLDRACRVPFEHLATPRVLSPFTIPLNHQITILEAQVDLAVEFGRNISIHSVKAQGATLDFLSRMKTKHGDRWNEISIDMHSCGLSKETWLDIERKYQNVFLSLSNVINSRHPDHRALLAACASDRILVESDYHDVDMCTEQTWIILQTIADVKGWSIEDIWIDNLEKEKWGTVRKLEENWRRFRGRNDQVPALKGE
ncbi:hypothetical protein K443DRAFT_673506 [Laccaria amethystina LaAM-08-1]|uniref:Unplaced genomic scaffold K443scaffold_13, whole genome shotgun sequence n=1 Tax=Laccaria amethystina LaAM-08-1 TaxID=1095629 RepID=A0A0C9YGU5_9AGAR|nr:hypothetical protein K443DRAFT_673506 [Laccaria amethystina LaAM-08-1]